GLRPAGALAHARSAAKGATGHLAEFFSQASQSQGRADREPDQSHRGGHARAEGSRRGAGQGGGGQSVGAIDSGSPRGYRRLQSADSGGGRSASRFFHLWLSAWSGTGDGATAAGGVRFAAGALSKRRRDANLVGDRTRDGKQWQKQLGSF